MISLSDVSCTITRGKIRRWFGTVLHRRVERSWRRASQALLSVPVIDVEHYLRLLLLHKHE